jgi:hypothetical protein
MRRFEQQDLVLDPPFFKNLAHALAHFIFDLEYVNKIKTSIHSMGIHWFACSAAAAMYFE